jgi:hypothetical protein
VPEGSPLELGSRPLGPGRLSARLRDADGGDILDLLPVLDDARRHGPCFHRSDPGWSDRGAFFVTRSLVKEAAKRAGTLAPLSLSRLHLTELPGYRGALADAPTARLDGGRYVPCEAQCEDEVGLALDAARLSASRMPVERHLVDGHTHVRLHAKPDVLNGPRLAVVGDELALALLPWLAESAHRTTFFWTSTPPMESVELELPDVLMHLIGHRDLVKLASGQ